MTAGAVIKLTCGKCETVYNVPEEKIPPEATAIKCKKCGERIPITRESADKIQLVCPKCNRKYRFEPGKIPDGVVTVKCKSCEHQMPVTHLLPKTGDSERKTCQKCGYQRTVQDDRLCAPDNCPKCGLSYAKARLFEARKGLDQSNVSPAKVPSALAIEQAEPSFKWFERTSVRLAAGLLLVVLVVGAYFFLRSGQFIENSVGMTFAYIPPGTFIMGTPEDEIGRMSDETQHQVTITEGFYLQTTETTREQWRVVMGYDISGEADYCPDCPALNITYKNVQAFIQKLSQREGVNTYRLPTEAEWEWACRGGAAGQFSFGENPAEIGKYAWYAENANGKAHPVGRKKANSAGLRDMHGNVAELCQDWHGNYSEEAVDPAGPAIGDHYVVRGGSWFDGPEGLRCGSRSKIKADLRSLRVGFRLVGKPKS